MATRKKSEPKKTTEDDMQGNLSFASPLEDPNVMRMLEVERQYQDKIEECGLNMPLLLGAILHELMLLRADKGGHK